MAPRQYCTVMELLQVDHDGHPRFDLVAVILSRGTWTRSKYCVPRLDRYGVHKTLI